MILENINSFLTQLNPWWTQDSIPSIFLPEFQRPQLKKIISYQKLNRITVIKGPRRTGKTTLMYQYIDHLLKKTNPKHILFISMDDLNLRLPLSNILDSFYHLHNIDKEQQIHIFIDEVQFLDNWASMVKLIHDRNHQINFVVSGSSASLLIRGSESLAGRTVEENIYPFSFREYLCIRKGVPHSLIDWIEDQSFKSITELQYSSKAEIFQKELIKYTKDYMDRGGFPHLVNIEEKTLWLDLLRSDIVQKAIYKDLSQLYEIKNPLILEKLFLFLASSTSGIANFTSIAQQLKISPPTLSQYINYLNNSFLIFNQPKYSLYPKEILKSQPKIHIIDPALSWLSSQRNMDNIIESTLTSIIHSKKDHRTYYWRKDYEVDTVVDINGQLIPIEIKNSNHPFSSIKYRGLINFMKKYQVSLGYVFYQGEYQEIKVNEGTIKMFPIWYVLSVL